MTKKKLMRSVATGVTTIDRLFQSADLRCTLCDSPMGTCDCWTKCACGWSYEKGTSCNNDDCHLKK